MVAVEDPKSPIVEEIIAVHTLHLAPKYFGNISAGIKETLLGYLLKYNEDLKAIPLVFSKADHLLNPVAPVLYDNPCVHLAVRVRWIALVPQPGLCAAGKVTLQSQEQLGLLLLDYFNVSIPAAQLGSVYRWDSAGRTWVSRATGEQIYLGDEIRFEIQSFSNDGDVTLIIGSVDKLTGLPSPASNPSAAGSPAQRRTKHAGGDAASTKGWQVAPIKAAEGEEGQKQRQRHKRKDKREPPPETGKDAAAEHKSKKKRSAQGRS